MARYWVYLNDEVAGPYSVEQLIRLRSFSRQTLLCVDDASGKPSHWISPAEIPELAHIFKAVDEHLAPPPASTTIKAPSKPVVPRAPRPYTPAVILKPSRNIAYRWAGIALAASLLAGGILAWSRYTHRGDETRARGNAKALVENARLPASSVYSTLQHYIQEKRLKPRWEIERAQEALYHVTLSWYAPALTVYAFEANVQAEMIRGLNTAASTLLAEGFPAPQAAKPKPLPPPKLSPSKLFSPAVESRREAVENGDFQVVWNSFSARKKSEMSKAGISPEGYIRLQGLTRRVDAAVKQTVLKTQPESDTEMLVLLKQSQENQPDIFVKQLWVFENGAWKLDDEQKRAAQTSPAPPPTALPGMSH